MKYLISLAFLSLLFSACQEEPQAPSADSPSEEYLSKDQVAACFKSYRSAILDQDGGVAVTELSRSTIDQYQKYVDWALTAEKQELESLSLINRMQVLMLRHLILPETLAGLDGKSAIVYAVDRDWIGKDAVIRTELGRIDVTDRRATAEVVIGGQMAPTRYQFRYEDGSWKFDLVSIMSQTNLALKMTVEKAGIEETDFVFHILESISDKKVDPGIWTPPY